MLVLGAMFSDANHWLSVISPSTGVSPLHQGYLLSRCWPWNLNLCSAGETDSDSSILWFKIEHGESADEGSGSQQGVISPSRGHW